MSRGKRRRRRKKMGWKSGRSRRGVGRGLGGKGWAGKGGGLGVGKI